MRIEEGSVAAPIPTHELDEFQALSAKVDIWFRKVAADPPPAGFHLPPDFSADDTGILLEFLGSDRPSTLVPTWTTDRNRLLI